MRSHGEKETTEEFSYNYKKSSQIRTHVKSNYLVALLRHPLRVQGTITALAGELLTRQTVMGSIQVTKI